MNVTWWVYNGTLHSNGNIPIVPAREDIRQHNARLIEILVKTPLGPRIHM